jgi:SAM-dependent methyltransferase
VSRLTTFLRDLKRRPQTRRILASIARNDVEVLRFKYPNDGWVKYLNLEKYIPVTVRFCEQLNLPNMAPQQILDIGCGTGLFLYCAKYYGHDGIGLDIENDLMGEMAKILGVERVIAPVRAFEPISIQGEFDLVTVMGTQFDNKKGGSRRWSCGEWCFFLRDLEIHLTPKGRVFLRINRGREALAVGRNYYDERVHGALLHGHLGGISYLFDRVTLSQAIENLEQAERSLAPSAAADC